MDKEHEKIFERVGQDTKIDYALIIDAARVRESLDVLEPQAKIDGLAFLVLQSLQDFEEEDLPERKRQLSVLKAVLAEVEDSQRIQVEERLGQLAQNPELNSQPYEVIRDRFKKLKGETNG